MIKDYITIVIRNLSKRKLRAWLTVIGIIIGITAIVALILLSQGMQNAINDQFKSLGISSIRVMPAGLRGPPSGELGFDKSLVDKINNVNSVDYAEPMLLQYLIVEKNKEEKYVAIVGYDPSIGTKGFADIALDLQEGRYFNPSDQEVIIIGSDVQKEMFKNEIRLKESININNTKFKIVGIFKETGTNTDSNIYMPIESLRKVTGLKNHVNGIIAHVNAGFSMNQTAIDIKTEMKKYMNEKDFDIYTPEQLLAQINNILGIVGAILIAIASISLVVGGLGIMNAMFTSVLERTREIGIMKAIGARNGTIMTLFLLESGIIGMLGGIIGLILGILLSKTIEYGAKLAGFGLLKIEIDPVVAIGSIAFAFIIGTISGLVPAYRASKMTPVDALRYE